MGSRGQATRRDLLAGAAGAAVAVGGAVAVTLSSRADHAAPSDPATTSATGVTQAGVDRPATPQLFGQVSVGDLASPGRPGFLAALGDRIAVLTEDPPADLLPDGPVGLTVTVGVGPRVVAALRPGGPGAEALPAFVGDESIDPRATGGDLVIMAYADDPTVLAPVVDDLLTLVPGHRTRWSQHCFRGAPPAGSGTIVRNPLGFHDNVQIPRTDEDLAGNVWLDGPLAGGTVCVLRRLRLDLGRFRGQPVTAQETVIGRHRDGSPLSGGEPFAPVDVAAKASNGEFLIPAHAHVRAAHPSFTGSHLMLRRGYAYDNGGGDSGLMFICFQRDLRTFVMTQRRLDAMDDLMGYVTPTGSGSFLILPGYGDGRPLGTGLL